MDYTNYTNQFDLVIAASQLPLPGFFDRFVLRRRTKSYRRAVRDLQAEVADLIGSSRSNAGSQFDDTVVTVLMDHSGSLNRFGKAETCLCIVETLSLALEQFRVKHEILGFTTRCWKGGQSRQLWLQNGEPENPGRLCDLLHIVYRAHEDTIQTPPAELSHLLRPALLKENIDGEALEWAEDRLQRRSEGRKLLFHVSDGAPVDDSTILANNPTYLVDHLVETIKRLESGEEIELYGIGVHHRVDEYFSRAIQVDAIDSAPSVVVGFLAPIFFDKVKG